MSQKNTAPPAGKAVSSCDMRARPGSGAWLCCSTIMHGLLFQHGHDKTAFLAEPEPLLFMFVLFVVHYVKHRHLSLLLVSYFASFLTLIIYHTYCCMGSVRTGHLPPGSSCGRRSRTCYLRRMRPAVVFRSTRPQSRYSDSNRDLMFTEHSYWPLYYTGKSPGSGNGTACCHYTTLSEKQLQRESNPRPRIDSPAY